jgi:hypothetical protein
MAARYWVGGTDNWNGTAGNKWATTSGGAGGAAVPVAADDVFIDNKNAPNWAASTAYALGVIRCPLATANGYFYEVTTAGTTGATEPAWPTVVGNTVTDGTVTWTCRLATVTKTTDATCLTLIFTNFIGTWTIANGITQTVTGTGATVTLGSGMTYTQGTTGVLSTRGTNTAVTINFNGITIPRLTVGNTTASTNQALTVNGTTPTVQNYTHQGGNASTASIVNQLTITTSFTIINNNGGSVSSTSVVLFSGNVSFNANGINIRFGFTVTTGSTLTLLSALRAGGSATPAITITFESGSFLTHNNNDFEILNSGGITLNSSVVEWYSVTFVIDGGTVTLTSDWNIANNVFLSSVSFATIFAIAASGGTRNVNIKGSLTGNPTLNINNGTVVNLIGTGTFTGSYRTTSGTAGIININTSNPSGYVLGNATLNSLFLRDLALNLVGSSVATVFNSSHNLSAGTNTTINTNNTGSGGAQILWANYLAINTSTNGPISFTNETTFTGNVTTALGISVTFNNAKVLLRGNLAMSAGAQLTGTSTLEFSSSGNSNWGVAASTMSCTNNVIINKSGGATVNLLGTITWGAASATLIRTAGNINAGTSTVTIPNAAVTINNMIFNNLTITSGATVTQNTLNTINGTLTCSGSATFAGTAGWTTSGFTAQTANSTITFSNVNANPSAAYLITGQVTIIGTLAQRIILQAAGSASFTGTANGTALTYASGTAPSVGMTVSQSTGQAPAGLLSLLPSRPTITGGTNPNFTISPSVTPTTGSIAMRAGFKAIFTLQSGATQNVAYTTTQDIDSSQGQTILSFGSNGDDLSSNVALFRTLNWGPLVAASGSVAFTWVN